MNALTSTEQYVAIYQGEPITERRMDHQWRVLRLAEVKRGGPGLPVWKARRGPAQGMRPETLAKVWAAMRLIGMSKAEIARRAKVSPSSAEKALRQLLKDGRIESNQVAHNQKRILWWRKK